MMLFFAPRMASSIAGKIWLPLRSVSTRLPSTSGGPSRTLIER